jgi:TusA-related sulfurtransferase
MATRTINAIGLRCPQPILQVTIAMPDMQPGDILEIQADCDSFEEDIRAWCDRLDKTLLAVNTNGDVVTATIKF